jgi:hypothetical protein
MNDQDDEFSDEEVGDLGDEAKENVLNRRAKRKKNVKITGREGMKTLEMREKIDLRSYD